MTQDFLAQIKLRLLENQSRLERDLSDFGTKDKKDKEQFNVNYPESGGSSDDDNAVEISEYADELSIGSKLEAELRDTIKALKALEDGTYGVCKYCGKEIDPKRLEARPTSATCIACKKTLTQEM